jgi:Kef-type K+ transport system membrane component KefB
VGHTFAIVMLDIAVIIVAARLFGRIARLLRQPAVIGEIVAGIALGPSLLGLFPGDLDGQLFPPDVQPYLRVLAQLGLVLFMFIVGLELDVALLRGRGRHAASISLASIVLPFALGAAATLILHPLHDQVDGKAVPLVALMLFMGVAMSITAFPVLARILTEHRMHRTSVGVLALAAAAVDDVIAWTLLAFIYAVAKGNSPVSILPIVVLSAAFVLVMFVVVRPLLARMLLWHKRSGRVTPDMLAVILIGVLVSALITERIGIHEIFGAFLFGAVMPRQGAQQFTREILQRLEQVSVLLLLPIFFVIAGFDVDLRGFTQPSLVWQLLLILAVAIGGKFIGAFVGARIQRMPVRQSAAIAVLMNTRGLTELVILTVGKQVGVLDTPMFTMMVVMALVTTAMTGPLLRVVYPEQAIQRDIDAAAKVALGTEQTYRVVVVMDAEPGTTTERMVRLADAALAGRRPGEIVLTRFLESADDEDHFELGDGVLSDLAGMAQAVESLETYAAQASTSSADIRVLCRFSSRSGDALIRQIASMEADVVVVSEDWVGKHSAAIGTIEGVTVLVVAAGQPAAWLEPGADAALAVSDNAVLVRDDGTDNGARAVLTALPAAWRSGRSLVAVVPAGNGDAHRRLHDAFEALVTTQISVHVISAGDSLPSEVGEIAAVARVLGRVEGSAIDLRDALSDLVDTLKKAT